MGQCYSVKLKFKAKDEAGALNALLGKIDKDEHAPSPHGARYHLDETIAEFRLDKGKLVDVLKVVLCERGYSRVSVSDEGWTLLSNDFDCCYGWHGVMVEAFETIAPYLEDGSRLDIWPDDGKTTNIVRNGVSVDPYCKPPKPEPKLCEESKRYKGEARRLRVKYEGVVSEFNVFFCSEMVNGDGWCGNVYRVRKSRQNTLQVCLVYEHVCRDRSKRYEFVLDTEDGCKTIKTNKVEVVKYLGD